MRGGQFVQVGTPQELVLNPKNEYVNAFVKDAPRAKVLTAAAIMAAGAPNGHHAAGATVQAETSLEALLPLAAAREEPLVVVNSAGAPLGYVDRAAILRALCQE